MKKLATFVASYWNLGERPMTASGGNFIGRELNRNKRAPLWGVATIEVAVCRLMKYAPLLLQRSDMESGSDLLSRAVSSQVPSALKGLTSVFGMGPGVTPSLSPPERVIYFFLPLRPLLPALKRGQLAHGICDPNHRFEQILNLDNRTAKNRFN